MKFLLNDPALKQKRRKLRKDQTDAEKALWARLRNRQLQGMRFLRQYSVGTYILDFYCPTEKLAIELDGGQHNERGQRHHDSVRSEFLKTQGIDVLRFWNHEVLLDIQSVLAAVERRVLNPTRPPLKVRGGEVTPPDLPLK